MQSNRPYTILPSLKDYVFMQKGTMGRYTTSGVRKKVDPFKNRVLTFAEFLDRNLEIGMFVRVNSLGEILSPPEQKYLEAAQQNDVIGKSICVYCGRHGTTAYHDMEHMCTPEAEEWNAAESPIFEVNIEVSLNGKTIDLLFGENDSYRIEYDMDQHEFVLHPPDKHSRYVEKIEDLAGFIMVDKTIITKFAIV